MYHTLTSLTLHITSPVRLFCLFGPLRILSLIFRNSRDFLRIFWEFPKNFGNSRGNSMESPFRLRLKEKICLVCVTKSENPASASRKLFFLKSEWGFHGIPSGIPKIVREFPKREKREVPGIDRNRRNSERAKKISMWMLHTRLVKLVTKSSYGIQK